MPDPIADLGITCPSSSKFYVCDNHVSRFLGCCTSDPCSTPDGKCPDTNIEATSFDPEKGSSIPPQSCAPGNNDDSTPMWYTCPDTEPSFMGCCTVNACSSMGCPVGSVTAARLSDRGNDAVVFLPDLMSSSSSSSARSTGTGVANGVTTPTTTITATATITMTLEPDSNGPSDGEMSTSATIAVAVTATMIGLGIIWLLFFWVLRRLRIASQDDDVPDFPHDKPDFAATADDPTSSSSSSIIELQTLYAELEQQKVRIHEAHLQAQAQAQAQEQIMNAPMPEMPGRVVLAQGDHKH